MLFDLLNLFLCQIKSDESKPHHEKSINLLAIIHKYTIDSYSMHKDTAVVSKFLMWLFMHTIKPYISFIDSFIQDGANLDTKNELGFKRNTNILIDDPDYWISGYEMISKLAAPHFIRVIIMNAFKISKHMEIIKMLGDFNCQSCIYENFLRQLVLICPYLINEPENNQSKPYEYKSTPADCVTLLQLNLEQLNIFSQSTTSKLSSDGSIMSKIVSVDKLIEDFIIRRVLESDKNTMSLNLENAVDGVLNTLFNERVKWCSNILMEKLFEKFHLFKYFEFMHSYFLFKSNEIMFLFSKSLFDLLKL